MSKLNRDREKEMRKGWSERKKERQEKEVEKAGKKVRTTLFDGIKEIFLKN